LNEQKLIMTKTGFTGIHQGNPNLSRELDNTTLPTAKPYSISERPRLPRAKAFSGTHNAPPGFLRSNQSAQTSSVASSQMPPRANGKLPSPQLPSINVGAKHYKPIPMLDKYVGEETGRVFGTSVKYLAPDERAAYRVSIQNGLMVDANGQPFDTKHATSAFGPDSGRAIFVMDKQGNIYVSNEQTEGKFHHSSFLAGKPVAAAGEILVEHGVIKEINRRSGHYCPSKQQQADFASHLSQLGVPSVTIDEPKNVFYYVQD
jgi:hypothetical protein